LPNVTTRRHIFRIHTSRMKFAEDVDLEELITAKDELSGADISASHSYVQNVLYSSSWELITFLFSPFSFLQRPFVPRRACWHCVSGGCG
jgi:hypothetical protein